MLAFHEEGAEEAASFEQVEGVEGLRIHTTV